MQKEYYSIGELSKMSGCPVETIRYYGKIGLITDIFRTKSNQRRYGDNACKSLLFILHARNLGFSIHSIAQLLRLSKHKDDPCHEADAIAHKQLEQTRARIKRLQLLEKELVKMTSQCQNHRVEDCKVLESLAHCETRGLGDGVDVLTQPKNVKHFKKDELF